MGKGFCMGLSPIVARQPTPALDGADEGLAAGMNVDVLDRDLLLNAFAPVSVGRSAASASCRSILRATAAANSRRCLRLVFLSGSYTAFL